MDLRYYFNIMSFIENVYYTTPDGDICLTNYSGKIPPLHTKGNIEIIYKPYSIVLDDIYVGGDVTTDTLVTEILGNSLIRGNVTGTSSEDQYLFLSASTKIEGNCSGFKRVVVLPAEQ